MTKQVVVAAIGLLLVTSCTPTKPDIKLDGTSKEAYEKSLILMVSGLTSDERMVLSGSIKIIQDKTKVMSQMDSDTHKRAVVSGKSRVELNDEARRIALDWFEEHKEFEKAWYQVFAEIDGKISVTVGEVIEKYGLFDTELIVKNTSNRPIDFQSAMFGGKSILPATLNEPIAAHETRKILCELQTEKVSKGTVADINYIVVNPIVNGAKRFYSYKLGNDVDYRYAPELEDYLKSIGQEHKKPG